MGHKHPLFYRRRLTHADARNAMDQPAHRATSVQNRSSRARHPAVVFLRKQDERDIARASSELGHNFACVMDWLKTLKRQGLVGLPQIEEIAGHMGLIGA